MKVIFLSFETLQRPKDVDTFITAWDQSPQTWQREVATHTKPVPNQSTYHTLHLSIAIHLAEDIANTNPQETSS